MGIKSRLPSNSFRKVVISRVKDYTFVKNITFVHCKRKVQI
jgi:hypothetical protein